MLVHQTPVSGGQTSPDEASLEKLRAANLNLRQESSASPADSASLPGQLARDLARQEAQEQLDRLQSDNLRLKNLLNQGGYTAALQLEEELRQSLGESLILRQSLVTADNRILELEQDSRRMEREQNQLRTIFHNSAGAFQAPLNDITILTGQLLDSLTAEDPNLDGDKLRAIQDKARDLKIQTEQLQRSSEPVPERVSVSEMALKLAAGLVSCVRRRSCIGRCASARTSTR